MPMLLLAVLIFGLAVVTRGTALPDIQKPIGASLSLSATSIPTADPAGAQGTFEQANQARPSSFVPLAEDPPPVLNVNAALLADVERGDNYFTLNADKRWPLASLTKLMTAAIALKAFSLSERLTVPPHLPEILGESTIFSPGERYTVGDMLHALLIASRNDAAEILANTYGREKFIAAMNEQAAAWGLDETHFYDPSGISVVNQSTAEDLKLLARHLYESYPEIFLIGQMPQVNMTERISGKTLLLKSTNAFSGSKDFLGGKTGYTEEARGNLLSVFVYEGRPLVAIVLGTDDRFAETKKMMEWFKRAYH